MEVDAVTRCGGIALLVPLHHEAQLLVVMLHPGQVRRGEDGGDAAQGGHGGPRYRWNYPGPMRRHLTLAIRLAMVVAVLGVVRQVLVDRSPHRGLHGAEPVIGSLDTWPPVPRRPVG